MSRKFNIGRQNDLLLNEKMHNLYTHLEFISYKDGDGELITMPRQTKQTAIPKGALWLQHPQGTNTHKLRVHTDPEASSVEERWPCLFEGYYHPITLKQCPENPVHGQLWIDDNNVLRVYNALASEGKWDDVCTKLVADMNYDVFNGLDFQLIDPLLPIELDTGEDLNLYAVPFESFGKYFTAKAHNEEFIYCHPDSESTLIPNYNPQTSENVISVDGESDAYQAKAWVHVNPYNLDKITKRLIKISKPRTYYKLLENNLKENVQKNTNEEGHLIKYIEQLNELGEVVNIPVFEIVDDNTKISDFEPSYMLKVSTANKNKYQQGMDFVIGDYITPITVTDQNTGFIPVPAGKTEYFAFKSKSLRGSDEYDNRIGRLLKHYSLKEGMEDEIVNNNPEIIDFRNDYEVVNGGILLDVDIYEKYDYIYAITYEFRAQHSIDGNLIRIYKESLDGPDQMWVGPCGGVPVVFMDGLYMEHYDEKGSEMYTYQNENIIFARNDILDNMQILVASFPTVNTYKDAYGIQHPKEYTINENCIRYRYEICNAEDDGALQVVNLAINNESVSYDHVILRTPDLRDKIDSSGSFYVRESDIKDAVVKGDPNDSLFDKENFPNPLIFYNGLAGYTFVDNEVSIDYETRTITIHNYGPVYDEIDDYDRLTEDDPRDLSTVFAVSLGENNYRGYGVLEDGVLYDDTISSENDYLIIVDGLVMSPYNEDITIEMGKITITDASVALDSECTFIQLTRINDDMIDDTDAILCIYDDMFAPYSIPIVNKNAMNTSNAYDDCDSAVVMCGPGALIDRSAILRDFEPNDVFVGGQIVKERKSSVTNDELYEWRMYTYSNEYVVLDPIEDAHIIQDIDEMVTYYHNDGTILLNPVNIDNQPVTVYAYTYVDSVDERLLRGKRIIPIDVKGHSENSTGIHTYSTNRTHLYDVGVNALSVYINGVLTPHTEKPTTDVKGDLFYVDEQLSSFFISYINRYEDESVDNRFSNQDMYNVLMAEGFTDDCALTDEIKVLTNTGIDHCLVMKYFNSEHQLSQAKKLKKYIQNEMKNNNLMYIIENVEHNEFVSCHRQWALERNDNGNLPNSYITTMRILPGIVNVYVNGVLLEKDDYAVFDNNKIMIGFDLVGGQEILPKNKGDYVHPYRVLTNEGFKYIECENNDLVTLEVRDDLTIKKRTYEIKDLSYDTYTFDILDYEFPKSLMYTKDIIKIYINGVLYDGNYTNTNGVITLLDCELEEDPLYRYLRMNPSAMEEYEEKYGEYIKYRDTITFEWR